MAKAIPAYPGLMSRQQPDGTTLSVRLQGDEYLSFTTTADGYTVTRRADGFYCYARLNADGQLEPTDRVARDEAQRSDDERQWLQGVGKHLMPAMSADAAARQQRDHAMQARARAAAQAKSPHYDYSNFRGLVILVEYKDRKFSREDYPEMVNDMLNQEGYQGYGTVGSGVFTGSVRDYFHDNSNGIFTPQFDVAGPFTLSVSETYPNQTAKSAQLMKKVVEAADEEVDFSQYDLNQDGVVDMVYIIFAGYGSNFGEGSKYIWPHASEFYNPDTWNYIYKDGVRLGRYACSTEMYGIEGQTGFDFFDGIGTICHEFSHVLGLMDLYDTDYEKSGGESNHPDDWSVMSGGSYLNIGRTPAGYNLYERYSLGFATPEVITEEGSYELESLGEANVGYRLNTQVRKEFFLIENRQQSSKWDKYLPGHGMLVFRVDSTNTHVWQNNTVNCNPDHNYFVMLRAGGTSSTGKSDPFPGTKRVTTLNNTTTPANLLTWSGKPSVLGFENISEKNGKIYFDIVDVNVLRSIELQETLTLGQGLSIQLEPVRTPDYAPYSLEWFTDNPEVCTVDALGKVSAHQVGEAVVTVVANGDENLSAHCLVIVEEPQLVPDVMTYCQQDDDVESFLSLNNALVIFTSENKVFVRDASGALCIDIEGLDVETGDLLNGIIYGKKTSANNIPMMVAANASSNNSGFTVEKGYEVTPRRISLADLSDADRCDLVTLTAVTLQRINNRVWVVGEGDQRIRVFNFFQVAGLPSVPKSLDGKFFDVTGIYYTNIDGNTVIDEIERTAALVEVEDPSGISTVSLEGLDAATPAVVYTTDGRLVTRTTVGRLSTLPLRRGLYIVKTAAGTWRLSH